jgi:hypothetical protein
MDKVVPLEEAMEKLRDGMTILIPGFVNVGVPETLIQGIIEKGCTNLNIISNNTSVKGRGIGLLVLENRIRHITCSHIGSNSETVEKVIAGTIDVTFVPQGKGAAASGQIANGEFHIPKDQGPSPGKCRVEILSYQETGRKVQGPSDPALKQVIPLRYNTTSSLECVLDAKVPSSHEFTLTSK